MQVVDRRDVVLPVCRWVVLAVLLSRARNFVSGFANNDFGPGKTEC